MIDYIITNRNIHPSQIMDVRAFTIPDVGSDHRLVGAKFRMAVQQAKKSLPNIITKFNVEAFQNESTKYLYTKRLLEKLRNITLITTATPDLQWEKIQDCIVKATEETLGRRTVNINASQNKPTPWFTAEIRELAQKKKKSIFKIYY